MVFFDIVVAVDDQSGIGKEGKLPWRLSADLKRFKEITATRNDPSKINAVIMGRKTWESLPDQYRPLPGRINIVLSRNEQVLLPEGVSKAKNLQDALQITTQSFLQKKIENIFVIGGAQIFKEALLSAQCRQIHLTRIKGVFHCDVFFPEINHFKEIFRSSMQKEGSVEYCFFTYERKI